MPSEDHKPQLATETDSYRWLHSGASPAQAWLLPAVLALLPPGGELSILDAGCGNGFLAGRLAALGHRVVGVDNSAEGVARARGSHPGLRFEVRSVYEPLREVAGDVDLIVATEVIEHLYSPRAFVENVFSALKPGGFFILSTPYHGFLKNLALSLGNRWDRHHATLSEGGHIRFFSARTLGVLLEACGFRDTVCRNAGRIPFLWKSMAWRVRKPLPHESVGERP